MSEIDEVKEEFFAQELDRALQGAISRIVVEQEEVKAHLRKLAAREQKWYMKLLRRLQGKKYAGPKPEDI